MEQQEITRAAAQLKLVLILNELQLGQQEEKMIE